MIRYILITIILLIFSNIYSQELGIRIGSNISENSTINKPLIFGININNKISNRFDMLVSYDYLHKKQQYSEVDLQEDFNGHNISVSWLYIHNIKQSIGLKIGISTGYCYYNIASQGLISRWVSEFKAHYLGGSIITGIEYRKLFNLPLSIEIFFAPSYYYNVSQNIEPIISLTEERNNLKLLNLNLGLKYTFKRNE
ncbi:MAG: hypothetical protein RBS19_02825 [Bacteroidales bacterium]|nr:hypothetical protein [Bacteroidales bacterium]